MISTACQAGRRIGRHRPNWGSRAITEGVASAGIRSRTGVVGEPMEQDQFGAAWLAGLTVGDGQAVYVG